MGLNGLERWRNVSRLPMLVYRMLIHAPYVPFSVKKMLLDEIARESGQLGYMMRNVGIASYIISPETREEAYRIVNSLASGINVTPEEVLNNAKLTPTVKALIIIPLYAYYSDRVGQQELINTLRGALSLLENNSIVTV